MYDYLPAEVVLEAYVGPVW